MSSINRQPKWDIYEAAILLDGYFEAQQGKQPKARVVKRLSADLRQMAINRGIHIDNIYRNENGISYQIQSMDSAYKGVKVYVPATKLFDEIVALYRADNQRYSRLLEEAKRMVAVKQNNKDDFLAWAASLFPAQRCKWIERNVLKVGQFAIASKLISESIFDVTDLAKLEAIYRVVRKNKIFQVTNRKILKNIDEDFEAYVSFCSSQNLKDEEVADPKGAKKLENEDVFIGDSFTPKASLPKTTSEIAKVLNQHYEYGIKFDSIRELMRFRQFADAMNIELPEDDEALKSVILSSGTVIDGKVYCNSSEMSQELQRIVDSIFSSGVGVIYYDSLFEKEQDWMVSHVITSPDMLKEYLQKVIDGCSFSKKLFIKGNRRPEKEAVTDELKRVWGEKPIERVDDLSDRLPYIPLGNIWRAISGNEVFVLASEGAYLYIDRFRISEADKENILHFVKDTCEEKGFASLSDVPLGSIAEENYELTSLTIYNAIYKKVLSEEYYLNGKILTKEKTDLDAIRLLKQYIKDRDECSFDEVADKVVELTGGTNRQYAFQALYDDMVRVDKNRFVANRFVSFDVDEIDSVLSNFITDNFRAIRDVTTFALFPICGQDWNYYLLESFCYKYSRKYSLHMIHFNDKNAGIIAQNTCNKNYNEMLAIALARTDVELVPEISGQYLFNTGYMAKSKYAKLEEITKRAMALRKERG